MNIHYNVETGHIMSFGFGSEYDDGFGTSIYPGCKVAIIADQLVDPKTQRFDEASFKIVDKEVPDPPPDLMPQVREIVRAELTASDKFMIPDYPISDAGRAAWAAYRQALRDASKGNDTAESVLAAIPDRPDGTSVERTLR